MANKSGLGHLPDLQKTAQILFHGRQIIPGGWEITFSVTSKIIEANPSLLVVEERRRKKPGGAIAEQETVQEHKSGPLVALFHRMQADMVYGVDWHCSINPTRSPTRSEMI